MRLFYRHRKFVHEYLANRFNGAKAAIAAGYAESSAAQEASRLLTNVNVIKYMMKVQNEQLELLNMEAMDVKSELMHIAGADMRKFYDEDGHLLHPTQWSDEMSAAVASVEFELGILTKVKLWSKDSALKVLGQHFNLFKEHEEAGAGEVRIVVTEKDEKL